MHASGASNGHRLTTAVLHGLTCNALPNHDCWISWDPSVTVFHFPNVSVIKKEIKILIIITKSYLSNTLFDENPKCDLLPTINIILTK